MKQNNIKSCPFCINDRVDKAFFSTSMFQALYNRAPILPGHALIVTKRHISSFSEMSHLEMQSVMFFVNQVRQILENVFPSNGFNLTLQDGESAGQTIEHIHFHIIPRVTNDLPDPGDWYPKLKKAETENIDSQLRPAHSKVELEVITKKLCSVANDLFPD